MLLNKFTLAACMQSIKRMFDKFRQFGIFVSSIINYLLLIVVYVFGVTLTWCLVKLAKKNMLEESTDKETFWKIVPSSDCSIERARRMY